MVRLLVVVVVVVVVVVAMQKTHGFHAWASKTT